MLYFIKGAMRHIANENHFNVVNPYTIGRFFDREKNQCIGIDFKDISGKEDITLRMTINEAVVLRNRLNELIQQ